MDLGFEFGSDNKQAPKKLVATQVVTANSEPVIIFNAQANADQNPHADQTTYQEVETTSESKKRQKFHGEKSSDKAWSVCFDLILPSQECLEDPDAAQRIGYKSRNPTNVKLAKGKTSDESADELAHKLYQLNILAHDVRRLCFSIWYESPRLRRDEDYL